MADNERRIVVEGVEFAQLVQFPRILRAVTAAAQPGRLVMGLMIVVLLMTGGRVWDWAFAPSVAPEGLMEEPWTAEDDAAAQESLARILKRRGLPEQPADVLDAGAVRRQVKDAYAGQRAELWVKVDGSEDSQGALDELREADELYLETLMEIDEVRPRGVFEGTVAHVTASFNRMVEGLVSLRFDDFFGGIGDLFVRTPIGMWRHDRLFALAYGLFFVVIVAIGGGAVARMAATEIALGERLRLQEAVDFAAGSWRRLVFSLLLPLLIAAVLSALLLGAGFFLMLPYMDVIGGLLYGVALLLGAGVVFLLVGYAAGASLLVPAVACENCDAADAQQRAYAYVLSRPLHLLGYGFVCFVGLAVGFVLASLFAVAVLNVTGALVDAATANDAVTVAYGFSLFDLAPREVAALPMAGHSTWSASLVMLWQTVIVSLVAGYVYAYYFSASTAIYLLMRQVCDGQSLDEIWQPGVVPGTAAEEPEQEAERDAETAEAPHEDQGR